MTTAQLVKRIVDAAGDPDLAARKVVDLMRRAAFPQEPWMSRAAVRFCGRALRSDHVALEWGCGRSTLWFGRRVARLTSVEDDAGWFTRISQQIVEAGLSSRIDLRLASITTAQAAETPYVTVAAEFADGTLDFVVVDGALRDQCIQAALPKLRPGGLLLVDNSNWWKEDLSEWGVPADWPIVHQSANVLRSETTIWQKPRAGAVTPGLPRRDGRAGRLGTGARRRR